MAINLVTLTVFGIVTCFFVETSGFLFGKKDCLVSQWTPWSGPLGFGQMTRERKILRYPANGGAACPTELEEETQTTQKPTIKSTAKAMVSYLMRQPSVMKRGEAVGQLRDLLVIVDSSGSITNAFFETAKTQLARLLGMLCPISDPFDSRYQRAALLEYSTDVKEIFDFDDKPSTRLVQQGVKSMPYMDAGTCTATAFNYAYNNMFDTTKGMRNSPDVKQEVLILTDGQSNCGGNATAAALKLQDKADVFGLMIGINTQPGMKEVISYVSYPKNKHLFAIEGFQVLKELVDEIEQLVTNVPCVEFDV